MRGHNTKNRHLFLFWDVVANPIGLLADSFNWMHGRSAKFTVLFGIFLSTAYALLYSLTSLGVTSRIASEARKATE